MSPTLRSGRRRTPAVAAPAPAPALRRQWAVEFSRFFNYPARTAATPAGLRSLPKRKFRRAGGTWLVAASPALLAVAGDDVLTVNVQGQLHEEHFLHSLGFSWPQVSCAPPCPIRGSRVVFASYRDGGGQIQKFAVRFATHPDAENFIDFVKESLSETTGISTVQNDFVCENSSPSVLNASNRIYHRFDEESNCEESATTLYHQELPALGYHQDQLQSPSQPVLTQNIENIFSGFPPSFTDYLNSCTPDAEKDVPQKEITPRAYCASQVQGHVLNTSHTSAKGAATSEQPGSVSVADLKTQIMKYMSDDNFHEMLSKIEKVISDYGGDMLLDG